jgi:alpha-beta hydrolase superfamily lysophospholipase
LALLLSACAPYVADRGPPTQPAVFAADAFIMADGYRLTHTSWGPEKDPAAIILGLHGFNDYSTFLGNAGPVWADAGIRTIAYDQRGFGATIGAGFWHGAEALSDDARTVAGLVRTRYPDVALIMLGESMGGAVAIAANAGDPLPVDGTILSAPAAADWEAFAWWQRAGLWTAVHTIPWFEATGRGLKLKPSDNTDMLRALSRDPLVIKSTRLDAVWGLLQLGDKAFDVAGDLNPPALVLWGAREELIPQQAQKALDAALPAHVERRQYEQGYHMLTRDLGAQAVLQDIARWTLSRQAGGS